MLFSVYRSTRVHCDDGRALVGIVNELCGFADKSMIKSNDITNGNASPVLSLTLSPPSAPPSMYATFGLCTINFVYISLSLPFNLLVFRLCRFPSLLVFLSLTTSFSLSPHPLSLSIDPVIVFSVFTVLGRSNQYR